jgi:3',5'-cyclic AMP phosphodiesterase CpdA
VHFVGLVNVANLKAGGMGSLGAEQVAWLADDLKDNSAATPIVLFAHIPLWTVAAEWGSDDSAQHPFAAIVKARREGRSVRRRLQTTTPAPCG